MPCLTFSVSSKATVISSSSQAASLAGFGKPRGFLLPHSLCSGPTLGHLFGKPSLSRKSSLTHGSPSCHLLQPLVVT